MRFVADLHVHSHYSRATARNLDLENLSFWAQLKGVTLVGTGDFTHPGWFAELKEKLVPREPGLYALKDEVNRRATGVPGPCRGTVRFLLSAEISNIYKKDGKTRKNHNVVFFPDMEAASRFNDRLETIGNIRSDGRPILGLDARDLLEIVLETCPEAFLVPAHIWTPWFSMLGSKSGFDSLKECFQDLSCHIFALETGLSSDPPMNWRVSGLDGRTLVSNSDAHSPAKLGREANLFDTELSYHAVRSALETGDRDRFLGTIEFFPEEGKYHFDGHRKCGVRLAPRQTVDCRGVCPVCGGPLTLGVLYRVEELADRPMGGRPERVHGYHSLFSLADILGEVLGQGATSRRVLNAYMELLETFGPELFILKDLAVASLERARLPLLGEAVERMRRGQVLLEAGYDGEYGTVRLFGPQERSRLLGQQSLFQVPDTLTASGKMQSRRSQDAGPWPREPADPPAAIGYDPEAPGSGDPETSLLEGLNEEQRAAVQYLGGPLLVVAGPGTGKTRTLTHRIAHLVRQRHVPAESVLAVTFTNKAAQAMRERLGPVLGDPGVLASVTIGTFHSFCLGVLKERGKGLEKPALVQEPDRILLVEAAMEQALGDLGFPGFDADTAARHIARAKQNLLLPQEDLTVCLPEEVCGAVAAVYGQYQRLLAVQGLLDFEDLILRVVRLLESDETVRLAYQKRFIHICVDEYQDINHGQYRLIRALAPDGAHLCAIGDPDQAIYGFRGSDVRYFQRFAQDYPKALTVRLRRNYRSTETILAVARRLMGPSGAQETESRLYSGIEGQRRIVIQEAATEAAEAETVVHSIEKMVGGTSHFSMDSGRLDGHDVSRERAFGDFAVLYRVRRQVDALEEAFHRSGIPYQVARREGFFQQEGFAELLSYLKVVEGLACDRDFLRIANCPPRGITNRTMDLLGKWAGGRQCPLARVLADSVRFPVPGLSVAQQRRAGRWQQALSSLKEAVDPLSVEGKLGWIADNLLLGVLAKEDPQKQRSMSEICRIARDFGSDGHDFLNHLALRTDADACDSRAQKVSLMTIHAAKGLEFPVVFVVGCEQGLIPFEGPARNKGDPEEERRLFYVAVTRAKERLLLTRAAARRVHGRKSRQAPSPFLEEIEAGLKEIHRFQTQKRPWPSPQVQLALFPE